MWGNDMRVTGLNTRHSAPEDWQQRNGCKQYVSVTTGLPVSASSSVHTRLGGTLLSSYLNPSDSEPGYSTPLMTGAQPVISIYCWSIDRFEPQKTVAGVQGAFLPDQDGRCF